MKSIDSKYRLFLYVLVADVLVGTAGFALFEDLSPIEAFYFTIVTITTVGYGDIAPITDMGRIVAGVLIITGVAAFTGVVATITERLVIAKEEEFRIEKMGIVLSVFYSEFGNNFIERLVGYDTNAEKMRNILPIDDTWDKQHFRSATEQLGVLDFSVSLKREDLNELLEFLETNTETLLRMLENPNLHKDSSLTELLRAILHFKEELHYRGDFASLPDTDLKHLSGDAARAYRLLVLEWTGYLEYIKDNYPYLYSLALRINPFKEERSAIIQA